MDDEVTRSARNATLDWREVDRRSRPRKVETEVRVRVGMSRNVSQAYTSGCAALGNAGINEVV